MAIARESKRTVLILALVVFGATASLGDTMRFTIRDLSSTDQVSTTGDILSGPLELSVSTFGGYAFTGTPTALRSGDTFTMTDLNLTCLSPNGCHPLQFSLDSVGLMSQTLPNGELHLHADGSAVTSGESAPQLLAYFAVGGFSSPSSPNQYYTFNNVTFGTSMAGEFAADSWREPSPYDVGPVSTLSLWLEFSGFHNGDKVSMPGSLGAQVRTPVATPEAGSYLELGTMAFGALVVWHVRRSRNHSTLSA